MRSLLRPSLLLLTLALPVGASAQVTPAPGAPEAEANGPGIRFNGLGRSYLQNTDLSGAVIDNDTLTADRLTDGNFILDLAVNAQPNTVTEVQGVVRLRNEFGGFFGAGATVEIRELWARGILADAISYRLGDLNLGLTPYTVYLPEAAGTVNEPEVFTAQQEVIAYEEFYTGRNERRFQGATVDFGLAFDQFVDDLDTRVFLARLRATDFRTTPTRLITGGRVGATTAPIFPAHGTQLTAGVNLAYTFDDLESGDATTGLRNSVLTFDGDLAIVEGPALGVHLTGEGGRSYVERLVRQAEPAPGVPAPVVDPLVESDDTFFELGVAANLKGPGVTASAMFMDVGPEFFSAAAQSKRVDYTRSLSSFNRVGADNARRAVSLFDLTRDPALYTSRVAQTLMAYDPRFDNVLPYGKATPNRRGVRLGLGLAPESGVLDASVGVDLLGEIRGQGTTELKDFVRVRASADVNVGAAAGLSRLLELTLGTQFESTSRGGVAIEQVDLSSALFEAGLAAEVYDRLDVLLGLKTRKSTGNEYVPQIVDFNVVRDFPGPFVVDDQETLLGGGLRYRFSDDVYLTVQVQSFRYSEAADPSGDYRLGQVFALYSMPF